MKYLFIIILLLSSTRLYAQCEAFDGLLKKGDNYLKQPKPNYQEAINAYAAAILACSNRAKEAQARIVSMVNGINKLKDEAEKAKKEVQAQLDQIRKKDQLQLSTYADNVSEALARYDISEARREMEKIRQTQIAPKDLLTRLEKQIADTVQTLMPDMIKVEGGTFMMGDEIQHQVTLSTYQIGKYEVTQALWQKVMGNNPAYFKPPAHPSCPTCPVEQVSWNDIQGFIEKINEKTGKKYRLSTEAEWEYAARGGNLSPFEGGKGDVKAGHIYAGTTEAINDYAWFNENSDDKTHPVGTKKPNELGIYDMSGNVWEWCSDWYDAYPTDPQTNPKGAETGSKRVFRGGSWFYDASLLRVADRNGGNPTNSGSNRVIGFRLARID